MKRLLAVVLLVVMCIGMSACTAKESVVGIWQTDVEVVGDNGPQEIRYVAMKFDINGTFTYMYYVNNKADSGAKGEYFVKDNQLTMRFEGNEFVCDYSIEADKLTLDYQGNTQVLTRVE